MHLPGDKHPSFMQVSSAQDLVTQVDRILLSQEAESTKITMTVKVLHPPPQATALHPDPDPSVSLRVCIAVWSSPSRAHHIDLVCLFPTTPEKCCEFQALRMAVVHKCWLLAGFTTVSSALASFACSDSQTVNFIFFWSVLFCFWHYGSQASGWGLPR